MNTQIKPSEILTQAKALIADPERWTQVSYARNKGGNPVSPLKDNAYCFCSLGAMRRIERVAIYEQENNNKNYARAYTYLNSAASADGGYGIADYNDTHTHAEVMVIWEEAIELAKLDEEKSC